MHPGQAVYGDWILVTNGFRLAPDTLAEWLGPAPAQLEYLAALIPIAGMWNAPFFHLILYNRQRS
jgi:hypothetical protein